ncbi:MAG: recombinase family protein [Lachnospirales bacterium]
MARKSRIQKNENIVNNTVYKVAFYIRISAEDEENNSIENQQVLLKNYIKDKDNFKLIETYIDNGVTGTNFERTRFKDLIFDIERNKINCIIVKDLSRFGRNYIETGKYLEEILPKKNVRFIAINDNYDSNEPNSLHILNLHIKNIINYMYAKDISKKICSSLKIKQLKGDFIGSVPCFGYEKSTTNKYKLEIDEYASNIVKEIFNLRLSGKSYLSIAKILNDKNIPCPNKYKFKKGLLFDEKYKNCFWSESTIKKILKNQVYLGHTIQGTKRKELYKNKNAKCVPKNEQIIVLNTHSPIIDEKTFSKVQKMNKNNCEKYKNSINNINKKSNNIYKNILRCGECGASLYLINGKNPYYKCSKSKLDICSFDKAHKEDIDNIIFLSLKTQINVFIDKDNIKLNNEKLSICKRKLEKVDDEINKFPTLYKMLYKDYLENTLQESEYIEFKENYKQKENELIKERENLQKEYDEMYKYVFEQKEKLLNFEDKELLTENLVNSLIENIFIYKDNMVEIKYNFKGEL